MRAGEAERGETAASPGWLMRQVEAQRGRAFLWAPVALTFGIWIYFGLGGEPPLLAAIAAALPALALFALARHRGVVLLAAMLLLGFAFAKARSDWVRTPLLAASTGEVALSGVVEDIRTTGKRRVLIVAPAAIAGSEAQNLPRRLRLSAFARQGEPAIGDTLTASARLAPLPTPVLPGGFDYGRQLYFEGIGGTGRLTGTMTLASDPAPRLALRLEAFLEGVRQAINSRIRAVLEGDTAAFAEALIDGERGTIAKDLNRSFQVSGLAHVLSISGLHMSLVAGGVFWLVRALLALVPALALRHPIKKWAAAAALAAGFFYMLLAGAEVATQRSYVMIAVVFFAVLVDRPALSLRNLALAALIILLTQPEAATQASFQMSFLAVLGLAAFFEAWSERNRERLFERREQQGWLRRATGAVVAAVAASLATTLVAGAMSSIPAAYHFGRVAPYGIVANGLAIPVVSLVVMPMALLATLLMPLGLEAWPLWLMGQGLDLTIRISDWVAALPGAARVVPQPPGWAAALTAFGAVVLCLLRGPLRWAGLALALAVIALFWQPRGPDVLITRTGSNVAFRNEAGLLVPMAARKDRFSVEKWLLASGDRETPAAAAKRSGWTCGEHRCTAQVAGKTLLVLREGGASPPDCAGADLVIADFPLRGACRAVATRIDRFDLWRAGAHGLTVTAAGTVVSTARAAQGTRPWVVVPKPRAGVYKPRQQPASNPFKPADRRGSSGSP